MGYWLLTFSLWLTLSVWQVRGQSCAATLSNDCYFDDVATIQPTQSNPNMYFVIGGLFDLHERGENAITCGTELSQEGIVNLLAFFWGINRESASVNPVSVGAVAFDNCKRPEQTIENLLGFAQCKINIQAIQEQNLVAYVGPYGDMDVKSSAMLATDIGVTLVSPGADAVDLHLPDTTLLRTSPSFHYDLDAMVAFLTAVDSDYVIVLYSASDPFWSVAYMELKKKLENRRGKAVCITLSADLDLFATDAEMQSFVRFQLDPVSKQKYVIPLMGKEKLDSLLKAIYDTNLENVAGKLRFILNSHIGTDLALLSSHAAAASDAIVLGLDVPVLVRDWMDDFTAYMQSGATAAIQGLNIPWMDSIRQNLPVFNDATPSTLKDAAARTLFSVKIIMNGMRQALKSCNDQFCDKYRNQRYDENLLYRSIRDSSGVFDTTNGQLRGSQAEYTYYHYENRGGDLRFTNIGTFRNSTATFKDDLTDMIAFAEPVCADSQRCCVPPTTTTQSTQAPTTDHQMTEPQSTMEPEYSVVRYKPDEHITGAYPYSQVNRDDWGTRFDDNNKWIIALGVLAGLGILSVVVFEIYILFKLVGTPYARKWRTMLLGQLLLFGIFCAYLVLFAYIWIPTKATCGITRFGVGVSYAFCFAVLLVKLMVILTSKSSDVLLPGEESPNYLKGSYQFLMFVFAVGVQVVIDVQWLIIVPPDAVQVTSNNGDRVWVCNHYTWEASKGMEDMSEFVRTNFENHVLSLVYIMFLILMTTILSLNAHGIITNHRESVFIGIASGFSIPIWLAWTLVGGLNYEDDYAQEFGDACIAFGLFLTVSLILFAMFLPKVRQLVNMGEEGIYVEDDRDTYYGGSVIMAPPSYKKGPPSVIYVNGNQGIYSEPVIIGNGDPSKDVATHLKHPGSTYSAPPTYLKRPESNHGSTRVLRVTDDLKGRHPQKRPASEVAYGSSGRPRSMKGTLPRSGSSTLGAL